MLFANYIGSSTYPFLLAIQDLYQTQQRMLLSCCPIWSNISCAYGTWDMRGRGEVLLLTAGDTHQNSAAILT